MTFLCGQGASETLPGKRHQILDLQKVGAIYAIQDAGLRFPQDIAIVGYSNREYPWIVRATIHTMIMPVYAMGRIAAEIL